MYQPNNVVLVQNKQKTGTEYLLKKKIKDTSKPLIYDNIITDGHLGFDAAGRNEYHF